MYLTGACSEAAIELILHRKQRATIESMQRVLSAPSEQAEWAAHRVEDLHRECLPAPRAPAVCKARPALADPT